MNMIPKKMLNPILCVMPEITNPVKLFIQNKDNMIKPIIQIKIFSRKRKGLL